MPKNVPRMAPARVPPEYWPEQDGDELVIMVVVACLATSTGVAGSRADAGLGRGDCQAVSAIRLAPTQSEASARTIL